jgi:DNA-binding beta-propeller fold protein YncE
MRPLSALVALWCACAAMAGCGGASRSPATEPGALPPCLASAPRALRLPRQVVATQKLSAPAGDVLATPGGYWFASTARELDVVDEAFGGIIRRLPFPAAVASGQHRLALSPDGRFLFVGAGSGALVFDVPRAERGGVGPILLGRLTSPVRPPLDPADAGAADVRVSASGRYVFVARARAGGVAVFDFRAALATLLRSSGYVGRIPVGLGPVGLALSPRDTLLYATALVPEPATGAAGPAQRPARGPSAGGILSVIDVARAEVDPDHAVIRSLHAGCEPVDVAVSPNGRLVWVAALGDHSLLGFDARAALRHPGAALVAAVPVAAAPARVLVIRGGRRLLVSDPTRSGGVAVVDTAAALQRRPAVAGVLRAGAGTGALAYDPASVALLTADAGFPDLELVRAPASRDASAAHGATTMVPFMNGWIEQ